MAEEEEPTGGASGGGSLWKHPTVIAALIAAVAALIGAFAAGRSTQPNPTDTVTLDPTAGYVSGYMRLDTQPISLPWPKEGEDVEVDFESATVSRGYLDSRTVDLTYRRFSNSELAGLDAAGSEIGYVLSADPTREECEAAAKGARLIPVQDNSALRHGAPFGGHEELCILTQEAGIVHLHLESYAGKEGEFKSYEFLITLWKKEPPPDDD